MHWNNILSGYWCGICSSSLGEQMIIDFLNMIGYTYIRQYKIQYLSKRSYDIYFKSDKFSWIIEYEGRQHFEDVTFFDTDTVSLQERQEIDIFKQYIALFMNHKIIRIDNIEYHIKNALSLNEQIYYSTPSLYKWLTLPTIDLWDKYPELFYFPKPHTIPNNNLTHPIRLKIVNKDNSVYPIRLKIINKDVSESKKNNIN